MLTIFMLCCVLSKKKKKAGVAYENEFGLDP